VKAVLRLIEAQPPERQAAILAAPSAILGLADKGGANAVLRLIEAQPPERQAAILAQYSQYTMRALGISSIKGVLKRPRLPAPYAGPS
jgi:hypothetical protein